MSLITDVFLQTQLAEAAYADFSNPSINPEDTLQQGNSAFSSAQAIAFVSNWEVIDHVPDTASGFSATIFRNRQSGAYTLSVRGTSATSPTDILNDINVIAGDGVAVAQLVDLYNFWQRANTAPGIGYTAAKAVAQLDAGNGTITYTINWVPSGQLADASLRQGSGALTITPALNVTGHSLGGHLAMAFTRLFPDVPSTALVVNALGFKLGAANVDSVFSQLGGASAFNPSAITNIYGIAGPEFAAMNNSVLQQPGGFEGIYIENGSLILPPIAGHSSVQMTNSAAVYDLFIRLSAQIRNSTPTAALATLKPLFEASSNQAESSLERVVDALVNLFGLDFPPLTEGNISDREALYERIELLQPLMSGVSTNNPGAHVDVLTTATAESLALLASGSEALAYRYALKELNPFAIVGDNTFYAIHNGQGQLDLYNSATRSGTLTESWLTERAKLLEAALLRNTQDNPDIAVFPVVDDREFEYRYYENGQERVLFAQAAGRMPGALPTELIQFADDAGRYLNGSDNVLGDKLFGGDGADLIEGRGGQDTLEGGRGMDLYTYNRTRRLGFFGNTVDGDGADTVLDADGKGVLRVVKTTTTIGFVTDVEAGVAIDASVQLNETTWQSADGRFNYVKAGADLVMVINGEGGGTVTLKNWSEGDFGIRLLDAQRTAPQTNTEILGDKKYLDVPGQQTQRKLPNGDPIGFSVNGSVALEQLSDPMPPEWLNVRFAEGSGYTLWQTVSGVSYYILPTTLNLLYNETDEFGNIKRTDEDQSDFADQLYDTPDNDNIIAGGGNDNIVALRSGADVISAGAGRDDVKAGTGNDLVEGGVDGTVVLGLSGVAAGGDMISGGAGDDELYGNAKISLSLAIKNGETDAATNVVGDFISGEAGNDWIIGDKGDDALLGGDGDDILVGGAGNDNLFGDRNHTAPNAAWQITRQVSGSASPGFNYQTLFTGVNVVADGTGGKDVLYGGAGDDWALGGKGDDFIDGGSGKDVLFGDEGSDVIIGGNDDDILAGDGVTVAFEQQGDDFLDGGAGKDQLFGYGGNDVLIGDAGDDILNGGEGNDILIGGTGLDQLFGGAGKDIYIFNRGDGTEIIVDTADDVKSPEASVVVLSDGISRSDIKFRKGSLMIDLGPSDPDDPLAGNDQIHFTNFNGDYPDLTAAIGEIRFADGTSMDYADILAQGFDIDGTAFDDTGSTALIGTSMTDRIRGFSGSDELEGRDGNDVLTGDGGSDRLDAGNDNDVLDGGAGSDFLAGGMGSDDYRFIRGDGLDTLVEGSLFVRGLSDPGNTDRIVFGEDIARAEVSLLRTGDGNLTVRYGLGDEILIEGQYSVAGTDIERIVFADGQSIEKTELDALEAGVIDGTTDSDEIYGTVGNDTLRGQAGDDFLDGGPIPERRMTGMPLITGDDVLDGGAGADTYALYWGMGEDRIIDSVDGQTNTLMLLEGATLDSVKTIRDGDDLRVVLRGGGGNAMVRGFFTDGSAATWEISSVTDGSQSLHDFYAAQSAAENSYVIDIKEDYKQRLLGEWRSLSEPDFNPPTHVYINSTWTQTIAQWERLVDAFPAPVRQTVTIVNDPVEHTFISGFGVRRGNRVVSLPLFGEALTQRMVVPTVAATISDEAFIAAEPSAGIFSNSMSYTFFAGGGGPFSNPRVYSNQNGFVTNIITESSAEGWAALNLRTDGLGQFRLTTHQILENPVIEEITAGASDNTIIGIMESSGDSVALIDAGAGNDIVNAGQYDFALGNEGDDQITGGAYAFGGSGFDSLSDGRFMAGGADDDLLSGGEGETTFYFRSDEAGWDQVRDQNGISLNEFALRAGFSDTPSNLVYGGKYRLEGEASLQFQLALEERAGGIAAYHDFLNARLTYAEIELSEGDFRRYPIPGLASGFPRGVPDPFFRGPAFSDGYATWVYGSVEDMMRDFSDMGMPFNPAYAQQIPEAADLSAFSADNHQALKPFFDSGLIEKDIVEFADFGDDFDGLAVGFAPTGDSAERRKLRLVWGEDKIVDIELPDAGDLIGHGVEEIRLGRHSFYIGEMIEWAETSGFIGTPFEDDLMGTAGNDRILGLAGWDFIEGGAGDDVLSGGAGIDEFFFAAGAGSDTILDPDAEDLILFDTSVTPDQIRLGLGSLRLGYGSAGEEIHFDGFDPDDVYGTPLFSALQFYDSNDWTLLDELSYGQVLSRGFDIVGTSGDDVLRGTNIQDRFTGGTGNDVLTGGAGSDTYFFGAGDGIDTINDFAEAGEINRVMLRDYRESDITGVRQGNYVVLRAGAGDALRILWNETAGSGVDRIEFSDGVVWNSVVLAQLPVEMGNSAPVLTNAIADQSATEDRNFSFAVPAGTFFDPDAGDTLTYGASLADGAALPAWLAFDPLTRSFNGTPANADVGTVALRVTAIDGSGYSASNDFALIVANVNDTPVTTDALADATVAEDSSFVYEVPSNLFVDVDTGDALTLSATRADGTALPSWLSFDPVQGRFSGTPGNADVGTIALRITATDRSGTTANAGFALNVTNTNDAPVLVEALVNQYTTENTSFSYTVPAGTFTDIDAGDVLTYNASLVDGTALPNWLDFNATTRAFSGTPPGGAAGELGLRVTATDAAGAQSLADFQLKVQAGDNGITMIGTSRSETLTGTAFNDVIDGRGGHDVLQGLAGNDSLIGGAGADRLLGGAGADILDGRRGQDLLKGGAGTDVYLFGRGYGRDVIEDDGVIGEIDTVLFGDGIALRDLRFYRNDGDLTIRLADSGDQLTIRDWSSRKDGVETLRFANGQSVVLREAVRHGNTLADLDQPNDDVGNHHQSDSGMRDDNRWLDRKIPGRANGDRENDKNFDLLINGWFDEQQHASATLLSWLDEARDGSNGIKESATAIRAAWETSERWLKDHQYGGAEHSESKHNQDFSGLPWLSSRTFEVESGLGINRLPALDGHNLKSFKGLEEGLRVLG